MKKRPMNKIKTSQKLDKLVDQIYELTANYDFDLVGEIDPDCYAATNEDKCRVDHFNSHIVDGMCLMKKSLQLNKPIYCIYPEAEYVFYFIGELKEIQKKLSITYSKLEAMKTEDSNSEVEELEKRLKQLKKKNK